ncbi:MAG: hypothetical protein DKT66_27090 [Candidatus Melainabacteria bacterium]|nr:MAG: hypothetical protein DKT66_27090 [Candidatus Melainabacteria bacterium]
MTIKRLEVLAMSALFLAVFAVFPPGPSLAVSLRGFPRLLLGVLIFVFVISLLMKCCETKKKCEQKEMYSCASCSTPYEAGSKFCHSCGAEL